MKYFFYLATVFFAASASAAESNLGQELFEQHCATCHGIKAQGDGPLTADLLVTVPDLTGLSNRNDGEFPLLAVIHAIDGRSGVRGHGGPMPVYGGLFRTELQPLAGMYGAEVIIRGRILAIAEYLASIQR